MEIVTIALKLLHESAKKIPNFDQRISTKYFAAVMERDAELSKPEHVIDDQKAIELDRKIKRMLQAFEAELKK
jgi:hypothetical protein